MDGVALLDTITSHSFSMSEFKLISLIELKNFIYKQSKTGNDVINLKIIKELFHVIGYPFLNLINTSLERGVVPDKFKTSIIVSVPKVPNSNLAEDMRPINMLPVCEKVLELVVYDQMLTYIKNNNILYEHQSGFRDKHSCETALQCVIADWKEDLNQGLGICAVFIDLKRAFETIDRDILILKLKRYGFSGSVLQWFESYLEFRFQKTRVENQYSESLINNFGVPQGSVLGPLLFILYINDLGKVLTKCKMHLFADDTLIYYSHANYEVLVSTINKDLENLTAKFNINRLKINEKKSQCMFIGSNWSYKNFCSMNMKIKLNNVELTLEDKVKYLGLILDRNLKFNLHVDYMAKKVGKKIGYFNRISSHLSMNTKLTLYNSIILPHFNYCASVIYVSNTNCYRLQILQNKAMRIILGVNRYASINGMLEVLDWVNIKQNWYIQTMIFIFKIVNRMVPNYLGNRLVRVNEIHSYGTRARENFYVSSTTRDLTSNSLFHKGIIEFNSLPANLKTVSSIKAFKKNLWNYVKVNGC